MLRHQPRYESLKEPKGGIMKSTLIIAVVRERSLHCLVVIAGVVAKVAASCWSPRGSLDLSRYGDLLHSVDLRAWKFGT